MSESTIGEYLRQLEHELRLKRAPRRRLLIETADHLESSAADLVAGGVPRDEAERRAVLRFGNAAYVAGRFAHAAASSSTRTALVVATAAFAAYALAALFFVLRAPSWLRDFPQGAPSGFALQVAFVALAVTALRAVRFRRAIVVEEPRLRFMANGAAIAALALGLGAALELTLALTRPAPAPWNDVELLLASFAVASSAAFAAAFFAVACVARSHALDALPRRGGATVPTPAAALVDDVAATVPPLTRITEYALARGGRACALVALASFCAMSVVALTGSDFEHHASILLGAAATGLFEAAAVVLGYVTLGRALGLRSPRRVAARR